jgi:2-polyprenyl-3-methyl-5-hydroxy-6-metoxy-1,4-benzoquinol methylase
MLAPKELPAAFAEWNERFQAPFGPPEIWNVPLHERFVPSYGATAGYFAFQYNNDTRVFEYPWAFHAVPVGPGSRVVEVGGALAGFQWALAAAGADVTNVDPFEPYGSEDRYPGDVESLHRQLNEWFGLNVRLKRTTLMDSGLEAAAFDIVYSISTLEHLSPEQLQSTLTAARELLKPRGALVLTVDLFLELHPFTDRDANRWGVNVSMADVVSRSGLTLEQGNVSELYGYPEFNARHVQSQLQRYLVGSRQPTLVQACVLRK